MGKKAPQAPDPSATIAAQQAANREAITESARVNAVDQYSPWGSTTYQRRGDGTPASQTIALSPSGQRIYDGQQGIAETLTGKAGILASRIPTGPMNLSGLPARRTSLGQPGAIRGYDPSGLPAMPGADDFGAAALRAQEAAFGKARALAEPDQALARRRLEQQLSDRGIPLDSAAAQAELDRLERAQSEATNRAAFDAVAAGGAEQSRLVGLAAAARGQVFDEGLQAAGFENQAQAQRFGQDLTYANFANDQRSAALQEALALRNQDFNEASALLQGAPVMGTPQFMNTPTYQMQPVDAAGIINQSYEQRLEAYKARAGLASGFANTLFGLFPRPGG